MNFCLPPTSHRKIRRKCNEGRNITITVSNYPRSRSLSKWSIKSLSPLNVDIHFFNPKTCNFSCNIQREGDLVNSIDVVDNHFFNSKDHTHMFFPFKWEQNKFRSHHPAIFIREKISWL